MMEIEVAKEMNAKMVCLVEEINRHSRECAKLGLVVHIDTVDCAGPIGGKPYQLLKSTVLVNPKDIGL